MLFLLILCKCRWWLGSAGEPLPTPGVGVTKPQFLYFPDVSELWTRTLAIEYHICVWQGSPQLSCGDICQIWMWLNESNRSFCEIENFDYEEIIERSFSNPHPSLLRHWMGAETRWPPLCRWHFQMQFSDLEYLCFWLKFNWNLYRRAQLITSQSIRVLGWCRTGHRALPEPMMTQLIDAYMCHQPSPVQWVDNACAYVRHSQFNTVSS